MHHCCQSATIDLILRVSIIISKKKRNPRRKSHRPTSLQAQKKQWMATRLGHERDPWGSFRFFTLWEIFHYCIYFLTFAVFGIVARVGLVAKVGPVAKQFPRSLPLMASPEGISPRSELQQHSTEVCT